MDNTQAANILKEAAPSFGELDPQAQIAAQAGEREKSKKKKTQDDESFVGTVSPSKRESLYKLYFRKLIDGQIKAFGRVPTKRSGITQIGPPEGISTSKLENIWKTRNPSSTNVPSADQIKLELTYEEATDLLNKYAKEAFGESKEHHINVSAFSNELRILRAEEASINKRIRPIEKEIEDAKMNIQHPGSFSEFAPKQKEINKERLSELEKTYNELEIKLKNVLSKIERITARREAISAPSVEPRVDETKLENYIISVLNVSANQESNEAIWPNESKRPPAPSTPKMATIYRYEQAIKEYKKAPSSVTKVEIEELYKEIEENASPIFADYFGLESLHLEGVIDPATNQPKFPYLPLMNVLISKLIEAIDNLAKKSEIVKKAIETTRVEPKLSETYTDISGNKQRLSRTIASISENEIVTFHNLFMKNKYEAVGSSFTDAERVMYSAIQKNLNAINEFLDKNKTKVVALANSLGNKLTRYAGAHPEPRNNYHKEFEWYGLDFLEPETSDIIDPNNPEALAKKAEDLQYRVRRASFDLIAKWYVNFMKMPPEAKPFEEVGQFLKLVDSKFNVQKEDDEAFETTENQISSAFFNPALFFLILADNRNKLNDPKGLSSEDYIRSDWGKHFRAYMGAQKLRFTSPREDLAVLLDIKHFMSQGFIPQQVAEDQLSNLGKRLKTASETEPRTLNTSPLTLQGDKDQLINSREFLNKLKESAPNDYGYSIFQRLISLKTEILNKKANKEYEAAKVLYDGPYLAEKENVVAILSPILREYLFQRYSQDTRLIETVHLFYSLLREFESLIEKYNPETDGDVEDWLLVHLEEFNKSKIVRAMHGGPERLWYIPQSNDQIKQLMYSILDIADIKESKKTEQFNSVRRLAPASQERDRKSSLIKFYYVDDEKKDKSGRTAYDREKERAIKRIDKRTGKPVYEVIDKSFKEIKYYSIEPKDSLVRDPEQAARTLAKIWHALEQVFWKNLHKIGVVIDKKSLSSNLGDNPSESALDKHYFDQLHNVLSGYKVFKASKPDKKGKVIEPEASSGFDKPNIATKTDIQSNALSDIDNNVMELLSVASIMFDVVNLDESAFMSRVNANLYSNVGKIYEDQTTINNVRAVVRALFRKDWSEVHDILFRPITPQVTDDNPELKTRGLKAPKKGRITPEQRTEVKEPLILTLGTLLAAIAYSIEESNKLFIQKQGEKINSLGIFQKLGVENLYSAYSRTLDSLKELLSSAFLHRLGKVQPMRGIPKGRGVTAKGRWGVLSFNMDNTASVRHPFTMHKKWLKMAEGLGYEFAQNQDPTSDTRQQAMLAMINAQNRFLYKIQQYHKKENGEEVGPNEGKPVNLTDILKTLGNSIEGEVGGAFRDMYRSRRFAGTSWKNGDLDVYHSRIVKKLRKEIEDLGYRVDRPEWYEQNAMLRTKALAIVEDSIKARYIKGVETGGALAGPGSLDSSDFEGTRDRDTNPEKYTDKKDRGAFGGNVRGVSGPSNPLHVKGRNPDARLIGDEPVSNYDPKYDVKSPEFDVSKKVDLDVDPGFLGATNITDLSQEDKEKNAALRFEDFKEIYPQFLEEKGMLNVSMFEPKTVEGEEATTLEDYLGEAASAEDEVALSEVIKSLDFYLDEKTFARIGSRKKKIFKTKEDALSGQNGEDKFIESYKDLNKEDTNFINSTLENLEFQITSDPFNSKTKFRNLLSNYKDSTVDRNIAFRQILFMKYFEYVYIREIIMAEAIFHLAELEESKETEEEKKERLQRETYTPTRTKDKIQKFIESTDIPIKHVPGVEYKLFGITDSYQRVSLTEILDQILGSAKLSVEYFELANDLIQYLGGRSDLPDAELKTSGISKKSNVQTDVHGMEITTSSKQEESILTAIDKKLFNQLNIRNVRKLVQDILKKDDEEENIPRKLTYDEIRAVVRDLIGIYISPITSDSTREEMDWYISSVKTDANKIRTYLHSFLKFEKYKEDKLGKIEYVKNEADNLIRFNSYDSKEFTSFKRKVWQFISDIYDLELGEVEDFKDFNLFSPKDTVGEIFSTLKEAETKPDNAWNSEFVSKMSETIKTIGRALKEQTIKVVVPKNSTQTVDSIYKYLVAKNGLLDILLKKLKPGQGKKVLSEETVFEILEYIKQLKVYIAAIYEALPPSVKRSPRSSVNKDSKLLKNPEYDPFEDDLLYSDKRIISDLEKQASISSRKKLRSDAAEKAKIAAKTPDQKLPPYTLEYGPEGWKGKGPSPKQSKKLHTNPTVKESVDFEPYKRAIAVQKVIKCIKTQAAGIQKLPYVEYGRQFPAKLSRVLFELSRQDPVDVDNYRVFITEENKSKVNIVFEYKDNNRSCTPEYMWVIPKRTTSSN